MLNIRILLLVCLVILPFHLSNAADKTIQHTVFIDAGSSGSRVLVFRIEKNAYPNIQQLGDKMSITPGISSLDGHLERVTMLKPLIDYAQVLVEKDGGKLDQTSIHLYATAGMRLLPKANQQEIYNAIKTYLKSFHYSDVYAQTLSGQSEGVFGWLSANYLLHRLNVDLPTYGVMDLGGASTQITFEVSDQSSLKNVVRFSLGNQKYTVFSHSFLGLGLNQASKAAGAGACYLKGSKASLNNAPGDFNNQQCIKHIDALIKNYNVADIVPPIPKNQLFLGVSNYYTTASYFFPNEDSVLIKPADLLSQAGSHCVWSKNKFMQKYDKQGTNTYSENMCFNAIFISRLLVKGYGFSENTQMINGKMKINGQSIEWPLGAALYLYYYPRGHAMSVSMSNKNASSELVRFF